MRVAAAAVLALGVGLGVLLGSDVMRQVPAGPTTPAVDATEPYGVDYLSESPTGSLPEVYLAMVSQLEGGE